MEVLFALGWARRCEHIVGEGVLCDFGVLVFLSTLLRHQTSFRLKRILRLCLVQQLLFVLESAHVRHFEKVKAVKRLIHELASVRFVRVVLLLVGAGVALVSVFYDFFYAGDGV